MNQTLIRCLDNELKTAALKKHANHKQTQREPEMPFKTLVKKTDQMDLTRTITNNHKRLYEVNQSISNQQIDLNQISEICNNTDNLIQDNLDQFENAVWIVLNGINNTYDRKNFKEDLNLHYFVAIVALTDIQNEDVSKDHQDNDNRRHMRNNQNLPNTQTNSNNVNGRQLPPTSPVNNNHRSRTPNRYNRYQCNQSNRSYNNNSR